MLKLRLHFSSNWIWCFSVVQERTLCNERHIASVSLHSTARLLNSVCWVHLFSRRTTRVRFLPNVTFFSNMSTSAYKVDHELCWARNSLHLNNPNVHFRPHKTPTSDPSLSLFSAVYPYSFRVTFNIVVPSASTSSMVSFPLRFLN
jgi:hypothetical protein